MAIKKTNCIQILISENYEIIRHGLKGILDQQNDFKIIGEASSCKETLMLTSTLKPDVILLDLTLNDGESIEHITQLKKHCPSSKILVFTISTDKDIHLLALRYGAVGILLKSLTAQLLCKAIRTVHLKNELWIDNILITEMWKQNSDRIETKPKQFKPSRINTIDQSYSITPSLSKNKLTPRENQIACLCSRGLSAKQIGVKLFISEKTVRNQLTIIYSKLNVKNQLELSINADVIDECGK